MPATTPPRSVGTKSARIALAVFIVMFFASVAANNAKSQHTGHAHSLKPQRKRFATIDPIAATNSQGRLLPYLERTHTDRRSISIIQKTTSTYFYTLSLVE